MTQQQKTQPLIWWFSIEYLTEWDGAVELQANRCSLSNSLSLVQLWEFYIY